MAGHNDEVWNYQIDSFNATLDFVLWQGFESAELMKLKKVAKATKKQQPTPQQQQQQQQQPPAKEQKGEAFISRQAAGLSFDFYPKDTNMWVELEFNLLAGTVEPHYKEVGYNKTLL